MTPGQVFWVDLPPSRGAEQHGRRPVVVVQAEGTGSARTRWCVPTSTSAALLNWRVEVEIASVRTVALTDQLRALDVMRLTHPAGDLSADELRDVVARLRDLLPLV